MFTDLKHNLTGVSETLELAKRESLDSSQSGYGRDLFGKGLTRRNEQVWLNFVSERAIAAHADEVEAFDSLDRLCNFSKVDIVFNTIFMLVFTIIAALLASIFSPWIILKSIKVKVLVRQITS